MIVLHYRKQKWFSIMSGEIRLIVILYKLVVMVLSSIWVSVYIVYMFNNWMFRGERKDDEIYMTTIVIFLYVLGVFNRIYKTNDAIEEEYRKNRQLKVERYMLYK